MDEHLDTQPQDAEVDFSKYYEKQETKQAEVTQQVIEQTKASVSFRKYRWKIAVAIFLIVGLSIALYFSLPKKQSSKLKIPDGYQLSDPKNGPPRLIPKK